MPMTSDMSSNDNQQADPADALADLADSNDGEIVIPDEADEVDPLSALDAMVQTGDPVPDPGDFAAAAAETVAEDVSDGIFSGAGAPLGASGRLHVTAGDGHRRHHVHMYKKTMIPLLLVVGVMLIVVGFVAAVMVFQAEPDEKFYTRYSQMKIVMYVSFPLAAVVLAGAWLFHRDVNKSGQTGRR